MSEPLVCKKCGQRGDEKPGFRRLPYPEAVGTLDGMIAVDSFGCNNCDYAIIVPKGTIEVRPA